jgi:hypothetical protein
MSVRYRRKNGKLLPTYLCILHAMDRRKPCQVLHGEAIDAAIGGMLVDLMKPMALELSMAVQDEIRERLDESDRLRRMHVEGAQYEVDLARQRYMQVDPNRRLVADSLEANWNDKLRALEGAREEYNRGREADKARLDDQQRKRILQLSADFPTLWCDPSTSHLERKRMTALIIEDVTLTRCDKEFSLGIRFRGGRTQTLKVPAPIRECDRRRTRADIVAQIDALLDEGRTDKEIAAIFNERGLKTGAGESFAVTSVRWVRSTMHIKSLRKRLRAKGMLTSTEMGRLLGVDRQTVVKRAKLGELRGRRTNDKGRWVFWPLDQQPNDAVAANIDSTARGAV